MGSATNTDDWRLRGQERYLFGSVLHLANYRTRSPTWDHDHCEFCWTKFTETPYPQTLQSGYTNYDNFHWVCPQCFNDFQERFQFTLCPRIAFGK